MKINLKLRSVSAYFSPQKITLADNEELTIHLVDRGRLTARAVLTVNGKTYLVDAATKTAVVPRAELHAVNTVELTDRSEADEITQRYNVENLYVLRANADDGGRLLAERRFYAETFAALYAETKRQAETIAELSDRIAALEQGKYTILKWGTKQ